MEKPITFASGGQQIVGILHQPESSPPVKLPAIAMLHGFTGHKAEAHRLFVQVARALCQAGFVVLRFDFRGSGDSAGEFEEMTVSEEVSDAIAALDFLAAQPDVEAAKIGVIGLSLGGRIAVLTALAEPRITFLVLYSAFLGVEPPESDSDHAPLSQENRHRLQHGEAIPYARGYYVKQAFLTELAARVPLQLMDPLNIPTLLVHGSHDDIVPVTDSYQGYTVIRDNHPQNHLYIVQGADHTYTLKEHTQEVIQVTKAWLTSLSA